MSQKTIKRRLKENGYSRGVYKKNRKKRMSWCRTKRWCNVRNQWSKVIFSDKFQICVCENNRVYVWKKSGEGWRPFLVTRLNGIKFNIMVWMCLCFHGVGTLCRVEGNINLEKCINILDTHLWPVSAGYFPAGYYLSQDDISLYIGLL